MDSCDHKRPPEDAAAAVAVAGQDGVAAAVVGQDVEAASRGVLQHGEWLLPINMDISTSQAGGGGGKGKRRKKKKKCKGNKGLVTDALCGEEMVSGNTFVNE